MAKRFTDSGKYRDPWFRGLSPKHKCIWDFMTHECNAAGILDIDLKSISFHIGGTTITEKDLEPFKSRLIWLRPDKVFIPGFILFQYPGGLKLENRAHKNIISLLEKYLKFDDKEGAWKPLASPLEGAKEIVTETVTETVQETVIVNTTAIVANDNHIAFEIFWQRYPKKTEKKACSEWWKKNPDKHAAALKGLEWYAVCKRVRDRYALDPIRYLNREIWNDDPAAYNAGGNNLENTFDSVMRGITAKQEENAGEGENGQGTDN